MRRLAAVLAALVLGCVAVAARATPITFTITSTNMNGSVGSTEFNNATMTVTLQGDTTQLLAGCDGLNVYDVSCGAGTGILTGTFTVGSSSGNFADSLYLWVAPGSGETGIGTSGPGNFFQTAVPGAATWDAVSSFGPVSLPSYSMTFGNWNTSLGVLSAGGDGSTTTFQAILGSPLGVPEPGALGLFGLGLLGLAGFGWRRRH